jgi:hypothetical protein
VPDSTPPPCPIAQSGTSRGQCSNSLGRSADARPNSGVAHVQQLLAAGDNTGAVNAYRAETDVDLPTASRIMQSR